MECRGIIASSGMRRDGVYTTQDILKKMAKRVQELTGTITTVEDGKVILNYYAFDMGKKDNDVIGTSHIKIDVLTNDIVSIESKRLGDNINEGN